MRDQTTNGKSASISVVIMPEGDLPLPERAPGQFAELVRDYAGCLLRAVTGADDDGVTDTQRELAERLAKLGAGPKDIIEIHRRATVAAWNQRRPAPLGVLEEGRLRLLQLMGLLASCYRQRSLGSP